jgi:hypothetical protein
MPVRGLFRMPAVVDPMRLLTAKSGDPELIAGTGTPQIGQMA